MRHSSAPLSMLAALLVGSIVATSSAQAFVICAKEDVANPGHPKEKSKLFLKIACNAAKHEVSVGLEVVGVVGSDAVVKVSGANLQVVSGAGATDAPVNGLGNLIVGYNANGGGHSRTGSHNIVVGDEHTYTNAGGLVTGFENSITGAWTSVSGGMFNTASGDGASVSGGTSNTASGDGASVSGGASSTASGGRASISGGNFNTASGNWASVSGGTSGTASGDQASVTGGQSNVASGPRSSVHGGTTNSATTFDATVSGGGNNTAAGFQTTIGGGVGLSVSSNYVWHAQQSAAFPTGTQY